MHSEIIAPMRALCHAVYSSCIAPGFDSSSGASILTLVKLLHRVWLKFILDVFSVCDSELWVLLCFVSALSLCFIVIATIYESCRGPAASSSLRRRAALGQCW